MRWNLDSKQLAEAVALWIERYSPPPLGERPDCCIVLQSDGAKVYARAWTHDDPPPDAGDWSNGETLSR